MDSSSLMPTSRTRASPIARSAWAVYALLLLYSGLAPWSGWRDLGVDAFAYLTAPLPRYITTFDLVVNVAAYLPFGGLGVLALHPRVRGLRGILLATLAGALLSAFVEAGQTYLPTRVSSNVDLLTNTLGALGGALLTAPFSASLIDRGRLLEWRRRWFERNATAVLMALALWPTAQIYPEPMLFGNGDLRDMLEPIVTALGGHWLQFSAESFGPAEYVLAEAFVIAAAILATGLALCSILRDGAPRYRLLVALISAGLAAKSIANAVQFGPERALAWMTPGAFGGLSIAVLSLAAATGGSRRWQAAIAWVAVIALLVAVNATPDNPYHLAQLQEWRQGRLLNFNAAARWLSTLWPLFLAGAMLARGAGRN
ncbi:MAG TPA: VanZ family protein [Burkholderiaceae bacterium]|nr:VanZ family protein [Burkholderiaceae bacterium]